MDWGFLWLAFFVKLPMLSLLAVVWWALRKSPPVAHAGDDPEGGIRPRADERPRRPGPWPARRGPHGGNAVTVPARRSSLRASPRRRPHRSRRDRPTPRIG
ncbi:hypothetical protein SAMN02745716_0501 [Thermoleophilum album]|uniref:Uncharacterized protein n=1 Tax=Thermoleophilum album TaxID=29539 RepID=A0A1H6FLD2_THEAL|nr:hypothetical protein SAMN02745716_0501 [Thermoleophilum album]